MRTDLAGAGGRARRTAAVVCCLTVVLVLAGFGLPRSGYGRTNSVDADRLLAQLTSLRSADGLLLSPPLAGPGRLDLTAWTALAAREAGVRLDMTISAEVVDRAVAEDASGAGRAWVLLWGQAVREGAHLGADARWTTEAAGLLRDGPVADRPGLDRAARILETWAASQVAAASGPWAGASATSAWALRTLGECRDNPYVYAHLHEIARAAGAPAEEIRARLDTCPATSPPAAASDAESALLDGVGRALVQRLRQAGAADRSDFAPHVAFAYDPWWLYHAARGWVASGGSGAEFAPVLEQALLHREPSGLVQAMSVPQVSLQANYFAVKAVKAVGRDPRAVVDPPAVHALAASEQAREWTDADWAVWGDLAYELGDSIPAGPITQAIERAARCSSATVTPGNARSVALCRLAHRHLGGTPAAIVFDEPAWVDAPDEAVVDARWSLGAVPPGRDVVASARAALAAPPARRASMTLIAAALAGSAHGLGADEARAALAEAGARRAAEPFSELRSNAPGSLDPDLLVTWAVARDLNEGESW